MKFTILALLLVSITTQAQSLDKSIAELEALYKELPMDELVDTHNYFVSFTHKDSEIENLIMNSVCHDPNNFKETNPSEITSVWFTQMRQAAFFVFQGRRRQQFLIRCQRAMSDLEKVLAAKGAIQICVDDQTPAYSDSHATTFVKHNNKILFVYEEGSPD